MKTQPLFFVIFIMLFAPNLLSAQSFNASIFVNGNNQCSNSFMELIAIPNDNQVYTYEWTCPGGNCLGGSNTNSFVGGVTTLSDSGNYSVLITEISSGDTASASISFIVKPKPEIIITPDNNMGCAGDPMNITATDIAGGTDIHGPYQYEWNSGASTNQVYSTSIGSGVGPFSVSVLVTNAYNCSSYNGNGFWVFGSPVPVINIASVDPTEFCSGGSSTLIATVDYDTSLVTLQWKKYGNALSNTDNINFTASTTGRYRCVATINASPYGCNTTSNFIDVTSYPLPQVSISPSGPLGACPNQLIVLEAVAPTAVSYQWKKYANNVTGSTYDTLQTTKAGKYKVIVEDANGCSKSSAAVEVLPPPSNQVSVSGPLTICQGDSVTFTAAPNLIYQWKKYGNNIVGETMQTYTAKTAGKYRVVVSNNFNCTVASKQYEVVVVGCPGRHGAIKEMNGDVTIYPNPVANELNVALHADFNTSADILIYDMSGRQVLNQVHFFENGNTVPLSLIGIKPGTYFIKVQSEDFSFSKVFVKE